MAPIPNCPQTSSRSAGSKLGAISCPMNPSYREREIMHQVNDSGAKVMVPRSRGLWYACVHNCQLSRVVIVGDHPADAAGFAIATRWSIRIARCAGCQGDQVSWRRCPIRVAPPVCRRA
jgi:hypothetical protein